MAAKVALVREVAPSGGLGVTLAALGLPRSTWYYQRQRSPYAEKYRPLRPRLEAIARAHPEYGYRRATAELREAYGARINHKVVQRLHQLWELPLLRGTRPPRPSGIRQALTVAGARANLVAGLAAIGPFEVVYTDFTALRYATGTAQLIPLLDHATKVVLGWAVGPQAVTALALAAWTRARAQLRRLGRTPAGVIVHHDQDPVFTGYGWTGQLLLRDGARLSYALRGAKDNPEMEAFNSRFKTENRSLFLDARDLTELTGVVAERVRYYNRERRHSTLGNQAPLTYIARLIPRR
ncbi:MAG: IS3 family transposase [Gammaproteobacteria bacterium]